MHGVNRMRAKTKLIFHSQTETPKKIRIKPLTQNFSALINEQSSIQGKLLSREMNLNPKLRT